MAAQHSVAWLAVSAAARDGGARVRHTDAASTVDRAVAVVQSFGLISSTYGRSAAAAATAMIASG